MTLIISRELVLLGLGLTLTACAGYQPLEANCFTFRDAPVPAAATATTTTATISTMGADVTRRVMECEFVMLGTGG